MLTEYYQKNIERFQKSLVKGMSLSAEKNKKCQYAPEQYKNNSEK